ncbi:site-specific DNA-methyltransferase [Cytobacillus sp. FSL R7-0696]|uniref:DNA-methyltransferase n=1 Tax=Cytobacillus sp. FSL R7-0696 TaxID=2921691 RepID=UPI0030F61A05
MAKQLLGELELNRIYQRDCIEGMRMIPDKSIDMILCDLPYGTTSAKWDSVIPFEPLWAEYQRIIKDNGAIVLTAAQPFTSALIMSNTKQFRYQWYWNKNKVTGFANAKKQPLRNVEDVVVFYKKLPTYNPQGIIRVNKIKRNGVSVGGETLRSDIEASAGKGSLRTAGAEYTQEFTNYPRQTLYVKCESKTVHPTQKPSELFEYLIRTYTNEGEIVLDNCMGSGTTAVAATQLNRNFIGFETEPQYVEIANQRLESVVRGSSLTETEDTE